MALTCPNVTYLCASSIDGSRYTKYPNGGGAIVGSMRASGWGQSVTGGGTITGPAPLAVHFDATDTEQFPFDSYRDCGFHFDFGYAVHTDAGTFTKGKQTGDNNSKGRQIGGPLAAHCYRSAGTKTASVRCQDPNGNYGDVSVSIVAQDADTVYSTTNTVCISLVANYTGAPAGATTQATVPSSVASNKRYLFHVGEDFSASTLAIPHGVSGFQIGFYGSGSAPRVKVSLPTAWPTTGTSLLTKGTIYGVDVNRVSLVCGSYLSWVDCTFWNVTASGTYPVSFGTTVDNIYNSAPANTTLSDIAWPDVVGFFECTMDGGSLANYGVYGAGSRFMLVGNDISGAIQHSSRYPNLFKSFIGHNTYGDCSTAQLKLHGDGLLTYAEMKPSEAIDPITRYVVIADDRVSPSATTRQITPAPQSDSVQEGVEDVIVERCYFEAGAGTGSQRAVGVGGKRITVRDIVVDARTATTHINVDYHAGAMVAADLSPYYLPTGDSLIDNTRVFDAGTSILPSKAGT